MQIPIEVGYAVAAIIALVGFFVVTMILISGTASKNDDDKTK